MKVEGKRFLRTYEPLDITSEMLNESLEQNEGKLVLSGILQKADTLNQNGRIYPRAILSRELRNYQKFINERRAVGCLDHPDVSVVNLEKASHLIIEAEMDQSGIVNGRVQILTTPMGKIVRDLVNDSVKLGISSRGVGSVKKDGDYFVVQDDYQLICWDIVADPSTPSAFILPEGRQMSTNEYKEVQRSFSRSDRLYRLLNDIG